MRKIVFLFSSHITHFFDNLFDNSPAPLLILKRGYLPLQGLPLKG